MNEEVHNEHRTSKNIYITTGFGRLVTIEFRFGRSFLLVGIMSCDLDRFMVGALFTGRVVEHFDDGLRSLKRIFSSRLTLVVSRLISSRVLLLRIGSS